MSLVIDLDDASVKKDLDEVHDLFTQTEPNTNYKTLDNLQDIVSKKEENLQDCKPSESCTKAKSFPNEGSQMN